MTPGTFSLSNGASAVSFTGDDIALSPGSTGGLTIDNGTDDLRVGVRGYVDQVAPHVRYQSSGAAPCDLSSLIPWGAPLEQTGPTDAFVHTTNSGEVEIAIPGVYSVAAAVHLQGGTAIGQFTNARLLRNGSLIYISRGYRGAENNLAHLLSANLVLQAGDRISVVCDSGASTTFSSTTFPAYSSLSITKLH